MRIAIVGATGNVGTALLRTLQSAGGHQLTGIARRVPPMQAPYSGVIWHRIDVSRSQAAARLEDVFSGIDCVVNLAWAFQPARDIDYLRRIGVGGLAAILTAAGSAGVPHLVHMSSVGTYSAAPRGRVVDESWPTAGIPELAYSVHKAAAEALLDRHDATGTGPAVCRLRPGLVMQREAGSALLRYGLPALLPAVALDLVPFLPLDRTFAVPVVHAHDVGSAVAAAVVRRAVGAFNLSTATPLTPEVLGAAPGRPAGARTVEVVAGSGFHRLESAVGAAGPRLDRSRILGSADQQRSGHDGVGLASGGGHPDGDPGGSGRYAKCPVDQQRSVAGKIGGRRTSDAGAQWTHHPAAAAVRSLRTRSG